MLAEGSPDVLILAQLLGTQTSCQDIIKWAYAQSRAPQHLLLPWQEDIEKGCHRAILLMPKVWRELA